MRTSVRTFCALAVMASALLPLRAADDSTRLLRFPTTNGNQIVFSYAGQLYTVGVDGGVARRLTDGPGYAVFPRFSADGSQLAFTAQYDGNTEVYVMPAEGGVPKRLTYTATLGRDDLSDRMGPNNIVMAWKNTANEIAFRSRMRSTNDFIGQLYTVGIDADLPKQIPVPRGGFLSYSPDDTKMAYNRIFREFRTWKRYKGGMADDVWVFDFKTGAVENISNNDAQDIIPMWAPTNRIYYISERTGRFNLFAYDLATKQTRQVTKFTDYDIKFPSIGKGGIVFEQAGYVWFFDLKTEQARRVPISVKEDFALARPEIKRVNDSISRVRPSPDGKRAVVGARGEVFTVPAKHGPVRNLTETSGVHERDAVWSPDGRWIAYISDQTGENEIWIRPQDGKGPAQQITRNADTYYYPATWSPDSRKLMFTDRMARLRYVDIETKEITLVEQATEFEINDFDWSPDSKWIAYVLPEKEGFNVRNDYGRLRLYSLESKQAQDLTDGWFNVSSPKFSEDGKFLAIASARDFDATYGNLEFNHIYVDMERVYLFTLAKDTDSPFKPRSDEVALGDEDKAKDEKKDAEAKPADASAKPEVAKANGAEKSDAAADKDDKKSDKKKKPVVVKVDFEGLSDRLVGLPVTPANYNVVHVSGDKVYYVRMSAMDAGEPGRPRGTFCLYDTKERKETELLSGVSGVTFTADGKKVLIAQRREYAIVDAPSAKVEIKEKDKLDLSGLTMNLDRAAEWKQIFDESWRQMRDFFYVPNMHGVDWPAIHDKYAALVPYVRHRNDLTYVIGEMISELSVGHAYVGGGDRQNTAPRIKTGLLGAEFSRDPASGAYRIDHIIRGENWQTQTRSPLTEIGVNAKEGEYVLAVNGKPVREMPNLYAALLDTVGKQVTLRLNAKPTDEGARDVVVVPIADEAPLYYYQEVQNRIAYVNQKTGGKVGYIHIPDMGPEGLNEFAKHFYPQLTKKALIIDVRGNGGGNVSAQVIERLRRQIVGWNVYRGAKPFTNPDATPMGPMIALCNEFSASDGDIFPFRFQKLKLGKVVGKRTWGGVVGIRGSLPFTDGGTLMRPEFTFYSVDGKRWEVEGHGVVPDIIVDNDPTREFKGEDQQLDRAIAEIMEELKTKEVTIPPVPPAPVKN
ncbi:S41 family peptidase [Opitutus sp. ER46]|uniref:S41 family peptidase n=1 Tax=Opitutus sp. ER46 TaxID=2161864 RepID=UPI000D31F8D5|nr:S41 family peptidase [Opitutus sp. ER46]PTY00078.1 protease [Opitutus sp. ER46]